MEPAPLEPVEERIPLTTVSWGILRALALTALTTAITLTGGVAAAFLREAVDSLGAGDNVQALVMGGLLMLAYSVVIAVVWIIGGASGERISGSVALRPVPLGPTLTLAFAAAMGGRLLAGVYSAALQMLGIELPGADVDPTALLPQGWLGIALTVVLVCVLAPIAEEMVFRGVLLSALRDRFGDGAANGISSAVFASVHVLPYAIPPIFMFSLLLGHIFIRSKSLWLPIAAHALFNGIGLAAVYLLRGVGAI